MRQFLYPVPVDGGPGLVDELVEERAEPLELLLELRPLTLRGGQQQLLQLQGQALLGVLLRQLLPLHAGRPLMPENLKVQFVSFYFKNFQQKWMALIFFNSGLQQL